MSEEVRQRRSGPDVVSRERGVKRSTAEYTPGRAKGTILAPTHND